MPFITASNMTPTEIVRVNGVLPIEYHERAARALELYDTLAARLDDLMYSLHNLSGKTKADLIVGLNDAFYAMKTLRADLD